MKRSLIQGLSEKDMQAVVNTYNLNAYYWPTLLPLKFTPVLTWKALKGTLGVPVAADVISYNAKAPRKTRNVVSRLQGDIPKISVGRDKEETDLNELNLLQQYAKTTEGASALLDWIYEDVEFCFNAVNARLEWLALRGLSTGKIVLDSSNNEGVVTETSVDFQVPDDQKSGVSVVWTEANAESFKPITILKERVKSAKKKGFALKYALMNQDTFDRMVTSKQLINACAGWVIQATGIDTLTPSLEVVNRVFASQKLPEIRIIESLVTIEINGKQTVVEPWEDGVVTLIPELMVGSTYYAPLADEMVTDSMATKVKRGHVLIKKYSEEEPLKECTVAMANAFPAWGDSQRSFLIDTLHTSWCK